MFTGIVVDQSLVKRARDKGGLLEIEIESPVVARELRRGDSVSVNGVCLTATATSRKRFGIQAMQETLGRSTLGSIEKGSVVNLELPARLQDRMGGHLVQGHVDGIATVTHIDDVDGARRLRLSAGVELVRYLVEKGSVALDGVSLTVVEAGRTTFEVALIPHTMQATNLGKLRVGQRLNVEVDVIAKYVERLSDGGN